MPKYTYKIFDPQTDNIYAVHQNGATIKELGQREKADIAINFSYANTVSGVPIGRLVVDGVQVNDDIPKTEPRDSLYMTAAGALGIGSLPRTPLKWSIQGSPRLLQAGKDVIAASVKRDQTGTDIYTRAAIRTAAGITAVGKLVIVRTYDSVTLTELAAIMKSLGCVDALNGDGGGSSYMWPEDDGYGRKLGAALIVKKGVVKPVNEPVLEIDPGHGGADPGASGNGMVEKEWTLKISLYQFERFKELGVPATLTRATDATLDPDDRTDIVKASGAKYCISNHLNAAPSTDAAGAEAIHSIHSDGKLAHALVYAIRDAGQILRKTPVFTKQRGDGSDYYFMHHDTGSVSTVIVEYGFMTNAADAARIKANWKAYAEAVVRAFCSFIGHAYSPPAAEPTKPQEPTGAFRDVPASHWAAKSIEKAASKGIINGVEPDVFGLGQPVTREQLAVMFDRLGLLE